MADFRTGFPNLAGNCFSNAALQCLLHIEPFYQHYNNGELDHKVCKALFVEAPANSLQQVIRRLTRAVKPNPETLDEAKAKEMLVGFVKYLPELFEERQQQDAGEFITGLFARLSKESNWHGKRADASVYPNALFAFYEKKVIRCDNSSTCKYENKITTPYYICRCFFPAESNSNGSKDVLSVQSLFTSQCGYSTEEFERNCDAIGECAGKKKMTTSFTFPSDYLIIMLERFAFTDGTVFKSTPVETSKTLTHEETTWRLVGMVHRGGTSAGCGHYWAVVLIDEQWRAFDDARVMSESEYVEIHPDRRAFSNSKTSYILFYKKQ